MLARIFGSKKTGTRQESYPRDSVPVYVHRILDAYITGKPLDFRGAYIPNEIREILDNPLWIPSQLQRNTGILTHAALNMLWVASQDDLSCCTKCCSPCNVLWNLRRSGMLEEYVCWWEKEELDRVAWWDSEKNQVDRAWLDRAWDGSKLNCHGQSDLVPFDEDELFGDEV